MFDKKLLLILTLLFAASCRQNAPSATNQAAKPAATASASPAPVNPAANPPASNTESTISAGASNVKNYEGSGRVTKINLKIGSVELDHEEIKELKMPAMRMEFYVSDPSQLKDLKVGDKVIFVLEDNNGAEKIASIKKGESDKKSESKK